MRVKVIETENRRVIYIYIWSEILNCGKSPVKF